MCVAAYILFDLFLPSKTIFRPSILYSTMNTMIINVCVKVSQKETKKKPIPHDRIINLVDNLCVKYQFSTILVKAIKIMI